MKIALCSAYNNTNSRNKLGSLVASTPPIGLGYIASYLIRDGKHNVRIFDDSIISPDELRDDLMSFKPEIVAFTTYTSSIVNCFILAKWIKELDPDIKVVFGGPHATYLPYETLDNEFVDIIVSGEGEQTMVELANRLSVKGTLEGLKGILYKDVNNNIVDNGPRPFIQDLDSIPFPAYELFSINKYQASVFRKFSNKNLFSIITSRGCPYRCTFCSHKMFGSKVRFRSAENVVDEMELLFKKYNVGEFYFLDDTFTLDVERVVSICDLILKRGLNVNWSCNLKVNNASKELFLKMKEAGCKGVLVGVESASQEVLDLMKKDITIDQIVKAVGLAKRYLGSVYCSFIFGMPGDTLQRANDTIEFAKELEPDYANFFIATLLPGSELFDEAVEKNLIDKKRVGGTGEVVVTYGMETIVEMSEIKKKDLLMLVKKAHREFYFRLSYIWKRLLKIRSTITVYHYILGAWRIVYHQFLADNEILENKK